MRRPWPGESFQLRFHSHQVSGDLSQGNGHRLDEVVTVIKQRRQFLSFEHVLAVVEIGQLPVDLQEGVRQCWQFLGFQYVLAAAELRQCLLELVVPAAEIQAFSAELRQPDHRYSDANEAANDWPSGQHPHNFSDLCFHKLLKSSYGKLTFASGIQQITFQNKLQSLSADRHPYGSFHVQAK